MSKHQICLILWLFAACTWHRMEARVRKSSSAEEERVHIKVHVPEIVRKHTHHQYKAPRQTRPHYAKRLPAHYAVDTPPSFYTPYDFELEPPLPVFNNEHEISAHIVPATLTDNDISTSSIYVQHQQEPQIRLPTIMPPPLPPTSALSLPTAEALYPEPDAFSTNNVADGNVLSTNDFLRDLQQLVVQHKNALAPTTLMSTLTSNYNSYNNNKNNAKKKKKRKRANNVSGTITSNSNNQLNVGQYYPKEQPHNRQQQQHQQQRHQQPQLQQGFIPHRANQAYSNYYYINNNDNDNSNYGKKHNFQLMDTLPIAEEDLSADNDGNEFDTSTEYDDTDSLNELSKEFSTIMQQQPEGFDSMESNVQQVNFDANPSSSTSYNPVSYQQLYATYIPTKVGNNNQFSNAQSRLKYKRKKQHRAKQQLVQLSSTAPIIATGIDGLSSTVLAPTATLGRAQIYGATQQTQGKRYRIRKNPIKVKRNRLMVQ